MNVKVRAIVDSKTQSEAWRRQRKWLAIRIGLFVVLFAVLAALVCIFEFGARR